MLINGVPMYSSVLVLLLATSKIPAGQSFVCTPTRVWDGDGPIWCDEGPHVRLAGVAAKEMDGTCRSNQPCPKASAEQARDKLVSLIGKHIGWSSQGHALVKGPSMICRSDGSAGGNRTAAWCKSPISGDVNCAIIRSGVAMKWDKYWSNHRC